MPPKTPKKPSGPNRIYAGYGKVTAPSGSNSYGGKRLTSLSAVYSGLGYSLPKPNANPSATGSDTTQKVKETGESARSSISVPGTTLQTTLSISADDKTSVSKPRTKEDKERELMPPPPADYITKTKAKSISPDKKPIDLPATGSASEADAKTGVKGEEDDGIEYTGSSLVSPEKRKYHGPVQMWTELYTPASVSDLATGNKRVAKVQNWIHEALYGYPMNVASKPGLGLQTGNADKIRKYKRILLLSGPAGSGKTTTVRTIAKEMGIDLIEWGEGADESTIGSGLDRESSTSKLASFLARHSYSPLNVRTTQSSSYTPATVRPRLILLTGLPNISHLPTRQAFHSALYTFCTTYSSSSCPMIIVHSEAGSGGRAEESWMDRDRGGREGCLEVLGPKVKDGPWCQEIDFIPIAPTFVIKALNQVLERNRASLGTGKPAPSGRDPIVQRIAITCNGDLRSAVNSLQMLKTQFRDMTDGDGTKNNKRKDPPTQSVGFGARRKELKGKGSRGGRGAKLDLDQEVRSALDAMTRKEQNLGLFHALGKILYNKRLGDPGEDKEDQEALTVVKALPPQDPLPEHLSEYERRRSLILMEEFLPTIPVDASSLALWLHECVPKFVENVEQASDAIDDLCRADIMRSDDDIWQASPQAIAYALYMTVSGVLMGLPSPVPRSNQKITKPLFFESYKQERDNVSNLDTASAYIVKRAVQASVALSNKPLDASTSEAAWGGLHTRFNLATEMVPMMIKIQNASGKPLLPSSVQGLMMPPYSSANYGGMEIDRFTALEQGDDFEESAAGEDGLGLIPSQSGSGNSRGVWDEVPELAEEEEEDGALGDEIEDWD